MLADSKVTPPNCCQGLHPMARAPVADDGVVGFAVLAHEEIAQDALPQQFDVTV